MDRSSIEPLLRLLNDERPEIAVAAVRALVRFPLSDEAWRAVAQDTIVLLDRTGEDSPLREELILAAAAIPVRSTRLRLREIVEAGGARESAWAVHALAEMGDPGVAWHLVRRLDEMPFDEWGWSMARLAQMPLEETDVSMADLPPLQEPHPDVHFWHALAYARLGSPSALEQVIRGKVDPPSVIYRNPWDAYAEIARARPLPDPLRAHLLARFELASAPHPEQVRDAGLMVWALTGIADAEGYVLESPSAFESAGDPVPSWSAAEIEKAATTARFIVNSFAALVRQEVDVGELRALSATAVGEFVRELLIEAHRFARTEEHAPHYMISNAVLNVVTVLPRARLPILAIYHDWSNATRPGVDAEQLAWILERGGAAAVVSVLAAEPDPASLDVLGSVGDVGAGAAGSPWRGAGGGGSTGGRQNIIEDVGWAESAPPPDAIETPPEPSRGVGSAPPSGSRGTGGPPPPPSAPRAEGAEPPPPGADTKASFPAVLSAQGPAELDAGQTSAVRVRIEREEGARPLAHATTATVRPEPISVMLFLSNEFVELKGPVLQHVEPPAPGVPREIEFPIVAKSPGETRMIVHFQQATTTLAMLTFTTTVVDSGASTATAAAAGAAATADPYDDGVVRILIQQPTAAEPHYTYYVTSRLLGLVNKRYLSPKFKEKGSPAERPRVYAQSIYDRIERAFLEKTSDAGALETRLERIGKDMCDRLFPESLVRELWKYREQIKSIEITPVEPYIPWEVLRLVHPEEGSDTRFLSEYRLVRVLGGREPARKLGRAEWRYVLGDYPNQLYADLPGERTFLTNGLPALGVTPSPVASKLEDILDAVEPAEFDVIHFACHGEASLENIDESALIVADRFSAADQKPLPVKVYPSDMKVNLSPRRPLVFLSACQSGRMAPSLTDFGGWPKVFVDAQAGAMVGTSWEVHEKPAVAFANAFYSSLLRGETLGEAAGAGRVAARALRDASWLAYTVYGWSSARMEA
jgi:hypothetical protein